MYGRQQTGIRYAETVLTDINARISIDIYILYCTAANRRVSDIDTRYRQILTRVYQYRKSTSHTRIRKK